MRLPSFTLVFAMAVIFSSQANALDPGENAQGWKLVRSLPIGAKARNVKLVTAPEPVHNGATSIRFDVRPGDCSRGKHGWNDCERDRERAELKQVDYNDEGDRFWYSFALFVPESHQNLWPTKTYFAQFHQQGARPAMMFANQDGGLSLEVRSSPQGVFRLIDENDLKGKWHRIVSRIHWSKNVGALDVWVNGRKVVTYTGPTMSAGKIYFKFGIYRSFVSRNPLAASVGHRAYFDDVRRASSASALGLDAGWFRD